MQRLTAHDGEIGGLAGETIQRALDAFTDRPDADDQRTHAERKADALYRICRIALDAGTDANMGGLSAAIVIDWSTFLDHLTRKNASTRTGESTAFELAGRMDGSFIGPINPADIEALLCDCTISRVITGPDSKPINVGQSRRTFPTSMRRAIVARDQHCRWPGCEMPPGWCEAHQTALRVFRPDDTELEPSPRYWYSDEPGWTRAA